MRWHNCISLAPPFLLYAKPRGLIYYYITRSTLFQPRRYWASQLNGLPNQLLYSLPQSFSVCPVIGLFDFPRWWPFQNGRWKTISVRAENIASLRPPCSSDLFDDVDAVRKFSVCHSLIRSGSLVSVHLWYSSAVTLTFVVVPLKKYIYNICIY